MRDEIVENKEERNVGIDLLRSISMLMICYLHVLGHGGMLGLCSSCFDPCFLLKSFCFVGVNVYAIISGYVFHFNKKRNLRFIELYITVQFYSVVLTLLAYALNMRDIKSIFFSFFPVISNSYWYFTAFSVVFFLMPLIDLLVRTIDKRICRRLIFFGVVLFSFISIVATPLSGDIFNTNNGYSFVWILFLFFVGNYIKHKEINLQGVGIVYVICAIITFIANGLLVTITSLMFGEPKGTNVFFNYQALGIWLGAVALVIWASNIRVDSKLGKYIEKMSGLTFGVYLISDHPVFREEMAKISQLYCTEFKELPKCLYTLFVGAIIYAFCLGIDYVRGKAFKLLNISQVYPKVGNVFDKIFGLFYC